MSDCEKKLSSARQSPNNVDFKDLCKLAECYGFKMLRRKGSHIMYENSQLTIEEGRFQNFQKIKRSKKAKPFQVRQLLKAIENIEKNDE